MVNKKQLDKNNLIAWRLFVKKEKLTEEQTQKFEQYLLLLSTWNEKMNLTRIIDTPSVLSYHFRDSMRIRDFVDFSAVRGVADVGSGGGFPGIPLSILYPDMLVVLIEVNQKKITFLETVIKVLGLENCIVSSLDWRTFLRSTDYDIDMVVARASLQPEELVRVFKPGHYQDAKLVYWASRVWEMAPKETKFFVKKESYHVGDKERSLIFFAGDKQE